MLWTTSKNSACFKSTLTNRKIGHINKYTHAWKTTPISKIPIISPLPHSARAPIGPEPPHCRGFSFTITLTTFDKTPLYGRPARRRDLYLKTHNTDIHVPGGIRTRNPSKWKAEDSRLRPRSHWYQTPIIIIPPITNNFWLYVRNYSSNVARTRGSHLVTNKTNDPLLYL